MKVTKKQSKKDSKELLYDGGDDAPDEGQPQGKPTKADKYKDDCDSFKQNLDKDKYAKGIVTDRQCTDLLCLIMFVVFLAAMFVNVIYCIKKGNIEKFMAPASFYGADGLMYENTPLLCGYDNETLEYPKLYLTHFTPAITGPMNQRGVPNSPTQIMNGGICVKKCPEGGDDITDATKFESYSNLTSLIESGINTSAYSSRDIVDICVPQLRKMEDERPEDYEAYKSVVVEIGNSSGGQYIKDLYLSSTSIYISFGTAFVNSILVIYLLSIFAEYVAWGIVAVVQLGFIGAAGFCALQSQNETVIAADGQTGMFALTGLFAVLAAIFLCMICCGYEQLKTAIDVLDASADFLAGTKRIFLLPVIFFFVQMIFIGFFMYAMISIYTMGEVTADYDHITKQVAQDDALESKQLYMGLFQFFGLLWILNFIIYKTNFVVMCSAASYYFNSNKDQEGSADVGQAISFAYTKHLGSIAFGALIISIIQFIRYVFMVVAEKAREASGDNIAVKIVIACASCLLKCFEKITDYINTAAFSYMAVSGDNFCSSAWSGFMLNMTYGLEFVWANTLASMFVLLSKVFIVVINIFCLKLAMDARGDTEEVKSVGGPYIVCAIASYFTANLFLGMMDETVVALLTSLCVDRGVNGEGNEQFGPPTFHDSIEKMPKDKKTEGGNSYNKVNDDSENQMN